jgi:hypothetical protein
MSHRFPRQFGIRVGVVTRNGCPEQDRRQFLFFPRYEKSGIGDNNGLVTPHCELGEEATLS